MSKWTIVFFTCIALFLFLLGTIAIIAFTPQVKKITHRYDAVVIHGYWLSQKDNGPVGLSFRSMLAVKAAAYLYRNDVTNIFVVPAGPVWGSTYPSIGKVMSSELQKIGVPAKNIIVADSGMDTNQEVAIFLSLAKEHHWQSLGDLAAAQHSSVIQALYQNRQTSVDLLSYEDIIRQYGTPDEKKILASFSHSFYEYDFTLYEQLVKTAMLFDPKYVLLGKIAQESRVKKSSNGGVYFLPTDIFQL